MKCPYCNGTGEYKPTIGWLLRQAREQKGMSQDQLAAVAKVSRNLISAIESDRGNPTVHTLGALFAALGLDFEIGLRGRAGGGDAGAGNLGYPGSAY